MAALAAILLLAGAVLPAPAVARVENAEGAACEVETETCFGVQRHSAPARMFEKNEELKPGTFANPSGHPVLHQSSTYAIFWDPDYLYLDPWVEIGRAHV